MKIYFLSSRPCALRLNGVFFGMTDRFERFADVCLQDRLFVEFLPQNALPVTFFLTEDVRFTPPDGVEVYLLKDAVALYARDFPPTDFTLRSIAQLREKDCLATVFSQGHIYLSIQLPDGFFTSTLPPSFAVCDLFFQSGLLLLKSQTQLALYTKKGECLLLESVLSYSVEGNVLRARLPLSDSLGRVADCAWELSESACTRTEFTLRQKYGEDGRAPDDELLPYAFFESVLIGANYADMLCDELAGKADALRAFLGDFVSVTLTDDPKCCALIRKKGERLYEAAYYTVTTEKGKISDITT